MKAEAVLRELTGIGASILPAGDRLKIRFPESQRPAVERLLPEVARWKVELTEVLESRKVKARVRGASVCEVKSGESETCWGCKGSGLCDCIVCRGQCAACRGTGRLAWRN